MRNWSNKRLTIVIVVGGGLIMAGLIWVNAAVVDPQTATPAFVHDDVSESVPAEPEFTCETLDEGTRQRIDLSMLDSGKVTGEPSAQVDDGEFYYAAAAIEPQPEGLSTKFHVVVRGKKFSTQLLAVNGMAMTFTDLKELGRMPEAGSFALECVSNGGA